MVRLRFFILSLFSLCFLVSSWAAAICDDTSRWQAGLVTKPTSTNGLLDNDTVYYTPSQFFSPVGAFVPDYTGQSNQLPFFSFADTSCFTDDFEVEVNTADMNGGWEVVFGMEVDFYEPEYDYVWKPETEGDSLAQDSLQPGRLRMGGLKKSRRFEVTSSISDLPASSLRDSRVERTSQLGFAYRNGTLYFLRNGVVYQSAKYDICKIRDFSVYWRYGGGGIISFSFKDNANNTSYFEDFHSCEDMQLFEECPPDPVVELTARVEMPSCQDSSLRFFSETNYLEELHWVGPDGKEFSTDPNPVFEDGQSVESGVYTVWGKLHRCSEPVVAKVKVDVVPLEPLVDTVKVNSCSDELLVIDGVAVTENGFYSEVKKTSDGYCDSITVYEVYVLHPTESYVELAICEGDSIEFNGKVYKEAGDFSDAKKSELFDCDSIKYEIHIRQHPNYFEVRHDTLCWGGSVDGLTETGIYTDSLTSVNGCDSISQLHLFVYPQMVRVLEDARICEGDTLWVGYEPITEAGDYELNMGSVGKCDSFVVVRVAVDPAFSLTKPEDVLGCRRVETRLEVDEIEGAQYHWSPVSFLSCADCPDPIVAATMDLSYSVRVKRGECVDSTSVMVRISEGPKISEVNFFPEMDMVKVDVVGGKPDYLFTLDNGLWQSSPTFEGEVKPGVSIAYVRDSFGCEDSKSFFYLFPIFPEDHMTPNGDGIKDFWEVENLTRYKHYTVKIFDRFGKLLVEYRDEYPGWDGIYNGHKMPSTDYWYVISVDEMDYEVSGHFTLLR